MNKHIEQAIASLRANAAKYDKPERYYNGDHDLAFATEKFANTFGTLFREFALNLCPVICDAVRDKLRVTGFSIEAEASTNPVNSVSSPNSATRQIWHRNRMATRAGELHKEVLKCGDAYILVWPNAQREAVLYPNRASSITVFHNEENPGTTEWAAKAWTHADKHMRINIFHPDRIERYISRTKGDTFPDPSDMIPFADGSETVIANPYGVVPVFHFANNADLGQSGRSELEAAMPVQDGLNKSVLDMLVAMEFSAFRQRWAAGIEVDYDAEGKVVAPFEGGVEHLWMTGNPNARFGDFEAAQLEQFLKVKDSFRIDMASVTGTPLHYFLQNNAGLPSGEALKKSETRFIAKIRDRQENFGQVWADAMAFALKIEGRAPVSLITDWEDPSPMSEREFLENILLKRQIGLPIEQALIEAGYGAADVAAMAVPPA